MELLQLQNKPANWDEEIKRFDTKTLFHETPWLEHIQTIHQQGKLEYFEIRDDAQTLGYLSAILVRKLFINVHGSPLGGTGTNFMGPVVNRGLDKHRFAGALKHFVKRTMFTHMEVANEWLDPNSMISHGFELHPGVTHVVELPNDEGAAWDNLKSSCRNRIRKAEKYGLEVQVVEDLSLAGEYYDQFVEVYAKQGMVTPFGPDRPRSLMQFLVPAKSILPLRIKHQGEVVATGLFPFDENCIYFWGAASWLRHHKLCPNELLHWTVIKHAISMGIPRYNMCGGTSQFKSKFGGADVPYNRYSMSSLPMMKQARNMYRSAHFARLQVEGWFKAGGKKKNPGT